MYLEVDDLPPIPTNKEALAVSDALEQAASAWNNREDSVDIEKELMRDDSEKKVDDDEEEEDED